ncbi:MAG TPA: imidazoleglycerol-phosphate dehydratase HisB [Candidatus Hydrogenedentes bacterium]|nr:imidazoleglycerol-phosphate dehydratase HisB [Candidatus Hydrogenedentota bacterium]HPG66711.1 imidazoleglycerol-phosphate dehydratase HisB [Candidatus Hydrogenedentota bacterium]
MRHAEVKRKTKETEVRLSLDLNGSGEAQVDTGVGFLDHMLVLFARHGLLGLTVKAKGDLEVDAHHTVEDVGICLGKALSDTIKDPSGLTRFGFAVVPMDESLAEVAVDCSGRPFLVYDVRLPHSRVGTFDVELVEEFFRAVAVNARLTLHINLRYGSNVHHGIEAMFKAFGRAVAQAVALDPRVKGVPSTKGMLET